MAYPTPTSAAVARFTSLAVRLGASHQLGEVDTSLPNFLDVVSVATHGYHRVPGGALPLPRAVGLRRTSADMLMHASASSMNTVRTVIAGFNPLRPFSARNSLPDDVGDVITGFLGIDRPLNLLLMDWIYNNVVFVSDETDRTNPALINKTLINTLMNSVLHSLMFFGTRYNGEITTALKWTLERLIEMVVYRTGSGRVSPCNRVLCFRSMPNFLLVSMERADSWKAASTTVGRRLANEVMIKEIVLHAQPAFISSAMTLRTYRPAAVKHDTLLNMIDDLSLLEEVSPINALRQSDDSEDENALFGDSGSESFGVSRPPRRRHGSDLEFSEDDSKYERESKIAFDNAAGVDAIEEAYEAARTTIVLSSGDEYADDFRVFAMGLPRDDDVQRPLAFSSDNEDLVDDDEESDNSDALRAAQQAQPSVRDAEMDRLCDNASREGFVYSSDEDLDMEQLCGDITRDDYLYTDGESMDADDEAEDADDEADDVSLPEPIESLVDYSDSEDDVQLDFGQGY
jgi:hypothetical protein